MAVITDTGTMGARRRPPLGRETMAKVPEHQHDMEQAAQGRGMADFMQTLETSVYGEARTLAAEGEAGIVAKPARAAVQPAEAAVRPAAQPARVRAYGNPSDTGPERSTPFKPPVSTTTGEPVTTPLDDDPDADTTPEREGGPIPMQRDVWRSQADAAEFERRLETLQSEAQITQLRDQAEHHRVAGDLFRRQGTLATEQAELTEGRAEMLDEHARETVEAADETAAIMRYEAGERSKVIRAQGEQQAADARRQAEIAGLNAEEKEAHFAAFEASAQTEITEMRIASLKEQANIRVASAGRGAGGSATERQIASQALETQRKVGTIGTQIEIRERLKDLGVEVEQTRAEGFEAAAEHAETVSELKAVMETETTRRRSALVELEGEQQGERMRLAADMDALEGSNLRIQGAQMFLRQDAQEKAATYAENAADITDWALDNRPAIPDYIAIGKEQSRQQALRNLGAGLGVIGSIASLAGRIFGF